MSDVKRKLIDVKVVGKEFLDIRRGFSIFNTDMDLEGVTGILVPEEANDSRVILNQFYTGGELKLKMKIITTGKPHKYKEGEKIATLILVD